MAWYHSIVALQISAFLLSVFTEVRLDIPIIGSASCPHPKAIVFPSRQRPKCSSTSLLRAISFLNPEGNFGGRFTGGRTAPKISFMDSSYSTMCSSELLSLYSSKKKSNKNGSMFFTKGCKHYSEPNTMARLLRQFLRE